MNGEQYRLPALGHNRSEPKMRNGFMESIDTIAGPFTRERTEELRKALDEAKKAGRSGHDAIDYEGQKLIYSFGTYLLEFLDRVWGERK